MCVPFELNSINLRILRHVYLIDIYSSHMSTRLISIYGSITSLWWKYSGDGAGFIAAAVVLTLTAARATVGLLFKSNAHAYVPLRWTSGRAVNQADSGVRGASDATAS